MTAPAELPGPELPHLRQMRNAFRLVAVLRSTAIAETDPQDPATYAPALLQLVSAEDARALAAVMAPLVVLLMGKLEERVGRPAVDAWFVTLAASAWPLDSEPARDESPW